jgi:hypothetical protein
MMVAGHPVNAQAAGDALEIVINGKTGIFFYEQGAAALAVVRARRTV